MPRISARVHPATEQIHITREGQRIGVVADFEELPELIDQLREIVESWPLRRQIEGEQAAVLAARTDAGER